MKRLLWIAALLAIALGFAVVLPRAQSEPEMLAKRRVFPEIGAGVRAIQRDAAGRYLILTAPAPAVFIYDSSGKRVGQIPAAPSGAAALVFGEDVALDGPRVCVADRGANAVKIYNADGSLAISIPIAAPLSVAQLAEGELAVASGRSDYLVNVYSTFRSGPQPEAAAGRLLRQFGDAEDIADRKELNRFLNIGRLAGDGAGNVFYAFSYLPEPTVRKYDHLGYAAFEVALRTIEFLPQAQATRREIANQEKGGAPKLRPTLTAVAADPASGGFWVALSNRLLLFDREGTRKANWRIYTQDGVRLEPVAILVEPDRLLLAADPLGIYEFARPVPSRPQ